jgi:hypothetical protein
MIVIAATHRAGRTEFGVREGDLIRRGLLDAGRVCCPEEAILVAWSHAATSVARDVDVRIVVTRRLLEGYLRLGWRPGSLRMLRALRGFAASLQGLRVQFIYKCNQKPARRQSRLPRTPRPQIL